MVAGSEQCLELSVPVTGGKLCDADQLPGIGEVGVAPDAFERTESPAAILAQPPARAAPA